MATKKTAKKTPAKAGVVVNKQRLTKLSRRDKEAHEATGYVYGPGIIPHDKTLALLNNYGIEGNEAENIIYGSWTPLGHYQMEEKFRKKRLSRAEIIEQAKGTAAVALELYDRIKICDPNIRAIVDTLSLRQGLDSMFLDTGKEYLIRVRALMNAAAADVSRANSKVSARTVHRDELLTQIVTLVDQCHAGLTKAKAREIAVALLKCWDVDTPEDDNKIRKAIKRAK